MLNKNWLKIAVILLSIGAFVSSADARSSKSSKTQHLSGLTERVWTLDDLGIKDPIRLHYRNHDRHLFFRVPAGIDLKNASFEVHATYHAPFPANTAVNFTLNGDPVSVFALSGKQSIPLYPAETRKNISITIPLKNITPKGGFVDLGISMSSQIESDHCLEERGIGNELVINPKTSRFIYHFNGKDVHSVRTVIASFPSNPAILISKQNFNTEKYETALRVALALTDLNFSPRFVVIPEIGDQISTAGMTVSSSEKRNVRSYESFRGLLRAISNHEDYVLNSSGEVAAWIYLSSIQQGGLAQIIIDPEAVRSDLENAFSGWSSLATWMQSNNNNQWLGGKADPDANNWVTLLGQQPALVIESSNIRETARMLTNLWLGIANGSVLTVSKAAMILRQNDHTIYTTDKTAGSETHYNFNRVPVLNVETTSSWVLPFRLSEMPVGQRPEVLNLNLIAAPNGDDIDPVTSVFLNENLLTAVKTRTDGRVTRLSIALPLYTLQNYNTLRIEVRRRFDGGHCTGLEQSYPVQILPSSYMNLGSFDQTSQFFMLASLLNGNSDVLVPSSFIRNPAVSLPYVTAVTRGLSVSSSTFNLVESDEASFSQTHPFVSFGITPAGAGNLATANAGKLVIKDKDGKVLYDTTGLKTQSTAQVVDDGNTSGVFIRQVNTGLPVFSDKLYFSYGDFAMLDDSGVNAAINMDDSEQARLMEQPNHEAEAVVDRYSGWLWLAAILFGLFILILITRWFFRRNTSDSAA